LYIPALMAVGAVHHALIDAGLRTRCNIVAATAHARDPHQFATLIGYGATAILPLPELCHHPQPGRTARLQPAGD
ncbi:glutamate synthase, large subunit, partial [Acidithiobacillus sp. GGI-221]